MQSVGYIGLGRPTKAFKECYVAGLSSFVSRGSTSCIASTEKKIGSILFVTDLQGVEEFCRFIS